MGRPDAPSMPTTLDYRDGDERAPGMFFLCEALDCERLGVTDVDAGDDGATLVAGAP